MFPPPTSRRAKPRLTVDLLARLDDLTEGELVHAVVLEPGEDAGAELKLLVQVLVRPAVVLDRELGRDLVALVGLEDAEGVELGNVVATDLESTDEELDLHQHIRGNTFGSAKVHEVAMTSASSQAKRARAGADLHVFLDARGGLSRGEVDERSCALDVRSDEARRGAESVFRPEPLVHAGKVRSP